jgi:predicted DNA-binding protein (MmcQ/YjbR family)
VPDSQILDWIDESYILVVAGLPKKLKEKISLDNSENV